MAREAMLWNKDKTASVKASKIREVTLTPAGDKWKVYGWYNANEYFAFGYFDYPDEARQWIEENIHDVIKQ